MALRNMTPVIIRPTGLSDAQDGTNVFPGAMVQLQNLTFSYHTASVFVPRPAGVKVIDFTNPTFSKGTTGNTTASSNQLTSVADVTDLQPGMTIAVANVPVGTTISSIAGTTITMSANATASVTGAAVTFASPANSNGVISEYTIVGTRVYGMVSSALYAGKDEPFCYDLSSGGFVTLSGVTGALLPLSPNTTGSWTPPNVKAINNVTLVVTHPGFPGGAAPGVYFGWIDTSGYSQSIIGNISLGSNLIDSVFTTVGNSAPILQGVTPGQLLNDPRFPVGTYVVSATNGTFSLNTTGNTHSNTTLDGLASVAGVKPGMTVTGTGILAGTYVTAVSGSSVTLSQAATATGTSVAVNFSGGGTITVSANATATALVTSLNITGGTAVKPRWGAGNTNTNPLSAVPSSVYGFNGRAYYGVSSYLVYSDPTTPMQVSLASQAVQIGDTTSITALAGLPLSSQLGGIQQSMTVFKGAGTLYQITGDAAASGGLSVNAIAGSVGTLAPKSIAGTPGGLLFMAVDGLRLLGLQGTLSPPMGTEGDGVSLPFLNALYPSRMVAAYNEDIYRITVQNGAVSGNPLNEYWYSMTFRKWVGPQTIPTRVANGYPAGGTFLVAPWNVNGQIWQSDAIPNFNSSYTENGTRLQCIYKTVLLPDNGAQHWNKVVQGTLSVALTSADQVTVGVDDDRGDTLATCSFNGQAPAPSVWGSFLWGSGTWGAATSLLREYFLSFPNPLVFRQARITATFQAASGQAIGNLYFPVQRMGMNAL